MATKLEELAKLLDLAAEEVDEQNEGKDPALDSMSMLCLESHCLRTWAQTIREELALERLACVGVVGWDDEPAPGDLH
jgi:hypothetical protein